ncbi:MAG: hypothetical protein A3A12_02710 [Candidatus Staskawiczbacteria bacterium RIFCSPLOWO2_01_FULL_43_17b]|nr:MAG: hypothetical protein A3A12_02710 [Candidatus Staskawiczbacteria bacterium RIFCSPLOWO2_01_FULL_43_17b]
MECLFLGLVGFALIWLYKESLLPHLNVVPETIVLVIFLGGLMGITRIPFPSSIAGKAIPIRAYPLISGLISGFMDSFLVLLLVEAANLQGEKKAKMKFKALNMFAALIGGLTLYIGEIYILPVLLKYGQRDWYSMLPMIPPVFVFLSMLSVVASKLELKVLPFKNGNGTNGNGHQKKTEADWGDYLEFAGAILLLLYTHDAFLCLGILLAYSFVTGQGEDLIDIMKTETEVGVMLLLVFAAFVAGPIEPYMAKWGGWWAFFPSVINGVLTGAIFPVSGDMWHDVHILSTAVLLTPISSLVGVMLFKTIPEWKFYIKYAFPFALAWFLIAGAWFYGLWPLLKEPFENQFGAPQIQNVKKAH